MEGTQKLKKRIIILIILLFVFVAFFQNLSAQGYKIKVNIPLFKDSSIILGHYLANGNALYPNDTLKLDKNGTGVFKGPKPLPGGMYFIYLPAKKYFDLILSESQLFSIDVTDTVNFLKTVKFKGSAENQLFYNYRNLIGVKSEEINLIIKKKKTVSEPQERDSLGKAAEKINSEVVEYINKIKKDNPQLFFSTFLTAIEDIAVPPPPKDNKGNIIDSSFQYNYWHHHFFDNFNYADPRLLRTPIYEKAILKYFEKVVPQMPDSINAEIDIMLNKVKGNEEVFRYLVSSLLKYYGSSQIVGMDAVLAHVAEKWFLPYATWIDKASKEKLKKEVDRINPNIIGKVAPDIKLMQIPTDHFLLSKTDTAAKSNPYIGTSFNISDIKAKYLVVVFWESDCGHCQKTLPFLYDSIYPRLKGKDVKILAVHMVGSVEGKRKWIDFVNEHQMYDWINAWSPFSYDYMDLYNVSYKPLIYILDENKKIICKRIGPEQIEKVIEMGGVLGSK
jgi:thiol-disulfide isomerase/thioredoxin